MKKILFVVVLLLVCTSFAIADTIADEPVVVDSTTIISMAMPVIKGLPDGYVPVIVGKMPRGDFFVFIAKEEKKRYAGRGGTARLFVGKSQSLKEIVVEEIFYRKDGGTEIYLTTIGRFDFPADKNICIFKGNENTKYFYWKKGVELSYFDLIF